MYFGIIITNCNLRLEDTSNTYMYMGYLDLVGVKGILESFEAPISKSPLT